MQQSLSQECREEREARDFARPVCITYRRIDFRFQEVNLNSHYIGRYSLLGLNIRMVVDIKIIPNTHVSFLEEDSTFPRFHQVCFVHNSIPFIYTQLQELLLLPQNILITFSISHLFFTFSSLTTSSLYASIFFIFINLFSPFSLLSSFTFSPYIPLYLFPLLSLPHSSNHLLVGFSFLPRSRAQGSSFSCCLCQVCFGFPYHAL